MVLLFLYQCDKKERFFATSVGDLIPRCSSRHCRPSCKYCGSEGGEIFKENMKELKEEAKKD